MPIFKEYVSEAEHNKIINFFSMLDMKRFAARYHLPYDYFRSVVVGKKKLSVDYHKRLLDAIEKYKKEFIDTM